MVRGGAAGPTLLMALLVILVAASGPSGGIHGASPVLSAAGQIDSDTVLIDVSMQPDGDADWEIRYRVRLDDDNATAAFESLERDVEANRSAYAAQFESRIQSTISAAENATGREMAVGNVGVRTTRQEIPQRYGVLIYSFEWTNFARVDGSRLVVGDAIGGLYLDEATSLAIDWPAGYGVVSTDPAPDETGDRSATWQGPMEFSADQPRVILSTAAASGAGPTDSGPAGDVGPLVVGAGAVAGLAALFGGALWWRRRRPDGGGPHQSTASTPATEPDDELLSNEERILRLLEAHGGRMKQQQVVEELGWTDAKTSQVVGDLRESGEVEGFRLGRENVLRLPDAEEDADS